MVGLQVGSSTEPQSGNNTCPAVHDSVELGLRSSMQLGTDRQQCRAMFTQQHIQGCVAVQTGIHQQHGSRVMQQRTMFVK